MILTPSIVHVVNSVWLWTVAHLPDPCFQSVFSLALWAAYVHLFVIGCHSLPCLPCFWRELKWLGCKTWNLTRTVTGSGVAGRGITPTFFISQTCLLLQILSYLWVCIRLVLMWGREHIDFLPFSCNSIPLLPFSLHVFCAAPTFLLLFT